MQSFQLKPHFFTGDTLASWLRAQDFRRVLLVFDRDAHPDAVFRLQRMLSGTQTRTWRVTQPLTPALACTGVQQLESFRADALLALGGEWAMNAAKASHALASHALRFVAIPSITSADEVVLPSIPLAGGQLHHALCGEQLLPQAVVFDSSFSDALKPAQYVDAGMHIIALSLESLDAKNATALSDAFAYQALSTVWKRLASGSESAAPGQELLAAACLAGCAAQAAGLGLCHAFADALRSRFPAPRGTLETLLLPAVLRFNAPEREQVHQHISAALSLSAPPDQALTQLCRQLQLPASFETLHIDLPACRNEVVSDVLRDIRLSQLPRQADPQQLRAILRDAQSPAQPSPGSGCQSSASRSRKA